MYDGGNREIRTVKTATVVMPYADWLAVKHLARRSGVKIGEYLHAIIKDAIADEGVDVRQLGSQGRTQGGEAGKASGAVAS